MDGNGTRPEAKTLDVGIQPEHELALAGDHRLRLERHPGQDVLRIEGGDGTLRVSVTVTPAGATVELTGGDLTIRSTGALAIDAQRLSLRSRETLTLESGADVEVRAEGAVRTEGHEQHHVSRRGGHTIYANDDVSIDGERIKMNC